MVKNLLAMRETQVPSLSRKDPLEKEMTTHSRILAWRIQWTEEPGGLPSVGSQRIGHNMYHVFFIHSSVSGHVSCFLLLAIVTSAAMNIVVVSLGRVQLFSTPWTATCQAPLSMGFPRQEYWSGLPFPSPRDLPDPGIEPKSPAPRADSLPSELPGSPIKMRNNLYTNTPD